ncbi:MAG: tRNA (N(6)-L-threonylcarbamoyladenosine(37)-C(2))-methylthiotransferase MtaB [Desulfobacteraceae bacterium]
MNKKFKIVTLGCKVNQYETASLQEKLQSKNWQSTEAATDADLIIVNTCIVTQRASYQSRQAVRKAIRENPTAKIAVVGCYPEVFPEELSKIDGVHILAGNSDKFNVPDILENPNPSIEKNTPRGNNSTQQTFIMMPVKKFLDRTRAFLKIQDGCDSYCSYCIVPYARGPVRSMEKKDVIGSINTFVKEGYKEIVLTGIHLGKYGKDFTGKSELVQLLKEIAGQKPGCRIRLSSLEPGEISDELIEMVASESWLCRHFHIPLQSGDKNILKKMNRYYSPSAFKKLILQIHKKIPEAAIGVDIIAGFPGEDEAAFNNSYSLIEELPVSYLHVFPFSPRKGTPAADYPGQVDTKEVKERAAKLRALGKRKKTMFYRSCLGKEYSVLTEGWESEEDKIIKGLSDNYLKVVLHSDTLLKNEIIRVTAEKHKKDYILGSVKSYPY